MISEWLFAGGSIIVLLALSAFFSGSETALTASSDARMHELARQGDLRARKVVALQERKPQLIGAILLGNNLVNIFASALATGLLLHLFGDAGVYYATAAMTALVVVFAEVLPKTYALSHADRMALRVAPAVRLVVAALAPISLTISKIIELTLRAFGASATYESLQSHREEELRGIISLHEGPAPEIRQERQMLRSILDLDDVEVYEVMAHRRNVEMLNLRDDSRTLVDQVLKSPYTRLPLYDEDQDNIVGVVHAKAVLRALGAAGGDGSGVNIREVAAEPWFIPDATSLLEQLQAFRQRREHFAIVVDEYGAFMGVVTLEDILEEIVGDIDDEHDTEVAGVRPQADGSYIVNGSVTIRDLNRQFDWRLPDDEATTIAGLVLHEARMIPEPGQVFRFHGFRFEILRRQRNQIALLRMRPPAAEAGSEPVADA
jgi:Mg2+/Co2+ transporter CorB